MSCVFTPAVLNVLKTNEVLASKNYFLNSSPLPKDLIGREKVQCSFQGKSK